MLYNPQYVNGSQVWFPMPACSWDVSGYVDCYFLKAIGGYGKLSMGRLSRELYDLQSVGQIRSVRQSLLADGSAVWAWRCESSEPVANVLRGLMRLNMLGRLQPLPDLEFVHPFAHSSILTLGVFSMSSTEVWRNVDPLAFNIPFPLPVL